jgi:hypothetical protein
MNDNVWSKEMRPRPDGWLRLNAKLNEADVSRRQEAKAWGMLAAGLTVALVLVFNFDRGYEKWNLPKPSAENSHLVPVEGTPEGIRFYRVI